MIRNAHKNELRMWLREQCLVCARTSLIFYAETKDNKFLEFAKYFGQQSLNLKNNA